MSVRLADRSPSKMEFLDSTYNLEKQILFYVGTKNFIPKDKTVQQRKVIKHLFTELDNNNIEYSQIVSNYNSWLGYIKHKDSDHIRNSMNRLYNKLLKENLHICSYY